MSFSFSKQAAFTRDSDSKDYVPCAGSRGTLRDYLCGHWWRCFLAEPEGHRAGRAILVTVQRFIFQVLFQPCATQVKSLKTLLLTKYSDGS